MLGWTGNLFCCYCRVHGIRSNREAVKLRIVWSPVNWHKRTICALPGHKFESGATSDHGVVEQQVGWDEPVDYPHH